MRRRRSHRSRRNPDSVLGQIAINTSQDVVLAILGCTVVGGIAYLIYKKSQDAGTSVGKAIAAAPEWLANNLPGPDPGTPLGQAMGSTMNTGAAVDSWASGLFQTPGAGVSVAAGAGGAGDGT